MNATALWLVFSGAAILGMVAYDVAIKLATEQVSVFLFTALLVLAALVGHLVVLGVFRYVSPDTVLSVNARILVLAILGGIGLVVMDVGFSLGVKVGGLASTNTVWLIGGLIATVLIGFLAFHEALSLAKIFGIVLGLVSIFLMVL